MYWTKKLIPYYNKPLRIACFAYCSAKPFWWQWFFGWRESNKEGNIFKLTEKQWLEIYDLLLDINSDY